MKLGPDLFSRFFHEVSGFEPFPWQEQLARLVCAGKWPTPIALPTAAGKTAAIDVAVFALACGTAGAARRIFFVVDRRVVVDEATEHARRLAAALRESLNGSSNRVVTRLVAHALQKLTAEDGDDPLLVATLRGGMPRNDAWARSPLQPSVCCSTVDQVGSSLLFRAYGARSPYNWPLRAGLAANDSLILIDEAHCSGAFVETAGAIAERYRSWAEIPVGGRLTVVELSATPGRPAPFSLTQADRRHRLLGPRLRASKKARLIEEPTNEALRNRLVDEALRFAANGARVVGLIVNRVATARLVFAALEEADAGDAILLTGRVRPWDRDRIWDHWRPFIEAGRTAEPQRPVFVVATQCIEVGANLDFDALLTETAALDALRQRFGRLNRLGRSIDCQALIVASREAISAKKIDPVYGSALAATWDWLCANAEVEQQGKGSKKVRERCIDMGIQALASKLPPPGDLAQLSTTRAQAPVLLPAHLDRLVQTSPEPEPSPDIGLFLHGPRSNSGDVLIAWRKDLDPGYPDHWAELVSIVPPSAMETLPVPAYAARSWLLKSTRMDVSDLEAANAEQEEEGSDRPVLLWLGVDESEPISATKVRPGMTIVVPASYGGCDQWGWNPDGEAPVSDIADAVSLQSRGRAVLRNLPEALARATEPEALRAMLEELAAAPDHPPAVHEAARLLARDRNVRMVFDPATIDSDQPRLAALVGSRIWHRPDEAAGEEDFYQEAARSSRTVEVELDKHQEGVAQRARTFAVACGLSTRVVETVALAARLHDAGKADKRFQSWLRGGLPVFQSSAALAKSAAHGQDMAALERARARAGYPKGGRHELQSVALLLASGFEPAQTIDEELLLHLIASHHGRCRPFAPHAPDASHVEVQYAFSGEVWKASSDHGLESFGSGVSERFWRLVRRYGWYGLAYLETLMRLADQRVSEEEQTRRASKQAATA